MKQIELTGRADDDLLQIYDFGASGFGDALAQQYNADLLSAVRTVVDNPFHHNTSASALPGVDLPDASLFSVVRYKAHYTFYVETDEAVVILTVIRQGRDLNRILAEIARRWTSG